jgi:hypothetical protein
MTWGIRAMGWVLAAFVAAHVPTAAQEVEVPDAPAENALTHVIGEEYTPCEDCPTFVRVPDAPDNLRPIRYVSKYELTWKNYLKSVDDGACAVPDRDFKFVASHVPGDVADNIDKFRLDFPIQELSPVAMQCYRDWLSAKVSGHVVIPTKAEWQWFATAGSPGNRFPWGNDIDGAKTAAVLANPKVANSKRPFSVFEMGLLSHHMPGVEVGQYAPNRWKLYDLFGSQPEVTSSFVEANSLELAGSKTPLGPGCNKSFAVMGHYAFSRRWSQRDISDATSRVLDCAGEWTAPVAVRFTIIQAQEEQ